jgi:hypothetical protein
MELNFTCFHSREWFTNRLYVGLNHTESTMKEIIFSNGKEKKGLGMTEYGCYLGRFLTLIGLAFKTKDEKGNDLYINKKSFCNLVYRLQENMKRYGENFIPDFVEERYLAKKNQGDWERIQTIRQVFNRALPDLSDKNIGEVSIAMLRLA